jgi:hypothetical protein
MDLTNEVKIKIIEQQDAEYAAMIYNHVVNKQVGEMTGDQKMIDAANAKLVQLQKCRDSLNQIRNNLEKK